MVNRNVRVTEVALSRWIAATGYEGFSESRYTEEEIDRGFMDAGLLERYNELTHTLVTAWLDYLETSEHEETDELPYATLRDGSAKEILDDFGMYLQQVEIA